MEIPRFQSIEGRVERILGSHRTTDVSVTETTNTQANGSGSHHMETHTFVNTSREFVMLLEVEGRTLKLVSDDYIAVAVGDNVRAIYEPIPNAALLVYDWSNMTRSIWFRSLPKPRRGARSEIITAAVLFFIGVLCLLLSDTYWMRWCALGILIFAGLFAWAAVGTADRLTRMHAELDRLST